MTQAAGIRHIFMCVNRKENGKGCASFGADAMAAYMKSRVIELLPLFKVKEKVKVVQTSCLGRCKMGPNIFISPDNIWYTFENQTDIDEIIESHFIKGTVLTRCLQVSVQNEPV